MSGSIRPARHSDIAAIVAWTTDTFEWGDYIPERLAAWLGSDDSVVLVSVDDGDVPVALAHVAMLSRREAWIEGARVRPDHRRTGRGSALNHAGVEWARRQGAGVIRLATEAENRAARQQVGALGYRKVSSWVRAGIETDPRHRAPDQFRLRRAPGSDADAAWLFWVASDLARESREMIALGWQWRTAKPSDVIETGELLQSPGGWVVVDQPEPDRMKVMWVATTPDDILVLLDGLMDLAAEREVGEIEVKLPNLGWTSEALRRFGADPEEILVYAKAIN